MDSYKEKYNPIEEPITSICGDITPGHSNSCSGTDTRVEGINVHVPVETKGHRRSASVTIGFIFKEESIHFPRFKHFGLELPKLPYEPYQRLMTYAIDVCYIPSIWYLELVHCIYMGMAPYFKGMLMSYSLQDVVGSAIKTMGYLDESYSESNCLISVSLFIDDHISSQKEVICSRMTSCLKNNHFSSEPFRRLKEEFQSRIDENYSNLAFESISSQEANKFARHSLLLGLSSNTLSLSLSRSATERNFLVIRFMILSLSNLYSFRLKTNPEDNSRIFAGSFGLIHNLIFYSIRGFISSCKSYMSNMYGSRKVKENLFLEFCCKEFLSTGFIDERVEVVGVDIERFNKAIMPSRVLDAGYAAVIPSNKRGVSTSDDSWLRFESVQTLDTFEGEPIEPGKSGRTKYTKLGGDLTMHKRDGKEATTMRRKTVYQKIRSALTSRKKRNSRTIRDHLKDNSST
ncbi:putative Secreted Protein (WYLE family) [Cryptosporidium felis]|nr:putative Secreted Protein (WYLE family) [Cryptosporidium felis]